MLQVSECMLSGERGVSVLGGSDDSAERRGG